MLIYDRIQTLPSINMLCFSVDTGTKDKKLTAQQGNQYLENVWIVFFLSIKDRKIPFKQTMKLCMYTLRICNSITVLLSCRFLLLWHINVPLLLYKLNWFISVNFFYDYIRVHVYHDDSLHALYIHDCISSIMPRCQYIQFMTVMGYNITGMETREIFWITFCLGWNNTPTT